MAELKGGYFYSLRPLCSLCLLGGVKINQPLFLLQKRLNIYSLQNFAFDILKVFFVLRVREQVTSIKLA